MALIVMADDGIAFDGRMAKNAPLGGAETAFVALAEALAALGHEIRVRNRCRAPLAHEGVDWAPLASGVPAACDLYIGNRGHRVIGLVPGARRRVFWLHNPAQYLRKPRNLWRLAWYRPVLVTTGAYHAATVAPWLPSGGRRVIPYGMLEPFRHATPREPPPPRVVFTSNPLRGLDWLLDLWSSRIRPCVERAELHVYAGAAVYGGAATRRAREIEAVLARADGLAPLGVRRHAPIGHAELARVLEGARAMLYRGDPGETFCLALAEAQAMGVPAIVTRLGSLAERVVDGVTGRVAPDDDSFAAAAIELLRNDALWRRWHEAALARQRGLGWDEVARAFAALMR
jgi:glycosyltransferase involved in cell wall biosynthesis